MMHDWEPVHDVFRYVSCLGVNFEEILVRDIDIDLIQGAGLNSEYCHVRALNVWYIYPGSIHDMVKDRRLHEAGCTDA